MLGSKLLILHISTMARVGSAVNIEAQKIIRQADNPQSGNVFASVSPEGRTEIDSELRSQDVNLHAHSTAAEDVVAKSTTAPWSGPWCKNLVENYNVWGRWAKGIDVGSYTGETLKWIGCVRENGCHPSKFKCKDTLAGIEFGTDDDLPLRAAIAVNGQLKQDHDEVCAAPGSENGVYNAFFRDEDAKELCKKMKFEDGKVTRKKITKGNSCPEVQWNGTKWTSDFHRSDGHASWIECTLKQARPTCSDLLVRNAQIWGGNATGINVSKYTDGTLHFIGCNGGVSCDPDSFSCKDTGSGIEFGSNADKKAVRALLGKDIPTTWGGCCTATKKDGACNNMDRQEDADRLCKQMGFGGGSVEAEPENECAEVEYNNGKWMSTYARTEGYGKKISCTWQIPTPAPTPAPTEVGACDFERDNVCGWTLYSGTGLFKWKRKDGPTESLRTGPPGAKSGRWYIYTEASSFKQGDRANLSITTDKTQLSLDYHMFGEKMGKLEVLCGDTIVWSKEGNQGDQWKFESNINLGAGNKTVTVRATRGEDQTNDFAIDNLRLYGTPAPTPAPTPAGPTPVPTPEPPTRAPTAAMKAAAYRAAVLSAPILSLLFMAGQ